MKNALRVKWHARVIVSIAALFLVLTVGCGSSGSGNTAVTPWTIFFYGHGDHNLTGSLVDDINKMAAATLTSDVKIIVAADYNAAEKDSTGANYPTGTIWYSVTGGGNKSTIKEVAEQNLDDPTNLTDAITYAFTNYPAQHYGVILWNHGGSWDGGFGGDTQDGTLSGSSIRGMTAIETKDAIVAGLSGAGISGATPLEFLAFDTCLMGGAEVAYLMKDLAKAYIANAELDFGSGWNYTDTFTALASNTSMTALEFAAMELTKWEALHQTASYNDELLRSHTAIDTSKIADFTTATKNLVDAINATKSGGVLPNFGEVFAVGSALSLPSYGMTVAQRTEASKYRDFGQFLKYLVSNANADISAKAQTVIDALGAMQIGRDYGTFRNPTTTYQLAFQIALPEISTITDSMLSDYNTKAAAWAAATGWKDFLSDLMVSKSSESPGGTYSVDADAMTGTLVPTGSSLTFASMEVLRDDPDASGEQLNYGAVYFGSIISGQSYAMTWDGKIWKVGGLAQEATVLPWFYSTDALNAVTSNTNNLLGAYGLVTDNSGAQSNSILIFKVGQSTADSIAYQSPEEEWDVATVTQFVTDHPGSTFQPARLRVSDGSLVFGSNTAEALPTSGGVAVTPGNAASGTYYLRTTSENAWGNATSGTDDKQIVVP